MFDSNAMNELRHVAADRYQRAGGGGATKVYKSSKAFHDARSLNLSPFRKAAYEASVMFRQACSLASADFRAAGNDYDLMLCERRDRERYALATIPF
jgi:hypothetical protein